MGIGPCSKDPPRQSKRDMIDNRQGTCSAGMKGRPTRNVPSAAGTKDRTEPMHRRGVVMPVEPVEQAQEVDAGRVVAVCHGFHA